MLVLATSTAGAQTSRHMFAWTNGGPWQTDLVLNGSVVVSTRDRGWYNQTGAHDAGNQNYIVGICGTTPAPSCLGSGDTHRNWFTFNIPAGLQITSATLRLFNPGSVPNQQGFVSVNPSETYSLYDVATAVGTLESANSGRTDIYDDLGAGTLFGQRVVSAADNNTLVSIGLNAAAITQISGRAGSAWAVGGSLIGPSVVVPEPSTYALLATGLAALAAVARRRRNA